jgi:hypothetical protein
MYIQRERERYVRYLVPDKMVRSDGRYGGERPKLQLIRVYGCCCVAIYRYELRGSHSFPCLSLCFKDSFDNVPSLRLLVSISLQERVNRGPKRWSNPLLF